MRQALDAGELVAVSGPDGALIPAWQVREDPTGGFIPGVRALSRIFPRNAVAMTLWVLHPSPDLGGRTPAQALADGDVDKVLDVARALTGTGW